MFLTSGEGFGDAPILYNIARNPLKLSIFWRGFPLWDAVEPSPLLLRSLLAYLPAPDEDDDYDG
jgi:hypothetical protein